MSKFNVKSGYHPLVKTLVTLSLNCSSFHSALPLDNIRRQKPILYTFYSGYVFQSTQPRGVEEKVVRFQSVIVGFLQIPSNKDDRKKEVCQKRFVSFLGVNAQVWKVTAQRLIIYHSLHSLLLFTVMKHTNFD